MIYREAIIRHLCTFFSGHDGVEERYSEGPMSAAREFSVMRFAPGPKTSLWSYCSVCASLEEPTAAEQLEFVMLAPDCDFRLVKLVTMVGYYHRTERLGVGHTFEIGEPWLDASRCDCILISLPYPFGPGLENMNNGNYRARVVWLLPITDSERQFAREHGLEALESRFDSAGLRFWDIARQSIV